MGEDFLHQPLGQQGSRATGPRRRAPVVAGSVVVVMALAAVAWTALRPADQRLAPRSGVVAAIVQPKPPIPAAPPAQVPSQAPAAEARNLAQADSTGDIRVVRPPGSSTTFGKFIEVPQDATTTVGLVPAPDPRLLELTPIGPLPRRGTDGAQAA